ncbi:MAG: hypothetical protein PQ975_11470, partial [Methanobacterium sp.]
KETKIVVILDNYPVHKAQLAQKACKILNIQLILLPPYSPKNHGIARISRYQISDENDIERVMKFAKDANIDIAVIGPEAPLEKGGCTGRFIGKKGRSDNS